MKAEAVIFDKDGTLIDFDAFWVTVSERAIGDILRKLNREDIPAGEFLAAFGIKNGVTDIDGILCKGTYEQMAEVCRGILSRYGCIISPETALELVLEEYNRSARACSVTPACRDIRSVLLRLKSLRLKLLVVTTDNTEITYKCLTQLAIDDLFERIITGDGETPPKPDPKCLFDFSASSSISPDRMVMVGDTMTDVRFARNAGIRIIGVGAREENRRRLSGHADVVVPDISHVYDVLTLDLSW